MSDISIPGVTASKYKTDELIQGLMKVERLRARQHSALVLVSGTDLRITSYNVCYTKLLRYPAWPGDQEDGRLDVAERLLRRLPGADRNNFV